MQYVTHSQYVDIASTKRSRSGCAVALVVNSSISSISSISSVSSISSISSISSVSSISSISSISSTSSRLAWAAPTPAARAAGGCRRRGALTGLGFRV